MNSVRVENCLPSIQGSYTAHAMVDSDCAVTESLAGVPAEADNTREDFYGTCASANTCPRGSRRCATGTPEQDYQVCTDYDATVGTSPSGCGGTTTCLCWDPEVPPGFPPDGTGYLCPSGQFCRAVNGTCAALPEWREIRPGMLIESVSRFLRGFIPEP